MHSDFTTAAAHPEKSSILSVTYPLMEDFYTLQGEGAFQGHAAYFIRLGGCDVGCVWCDVKDSWDAGKHPLVSVEEMVQRASAHKGRMAVITGGEPFMYNLEPLITALKHAGFRVHVETSGAYPYSGMPDWVCLSPKKFKSALSEWYGVADELKVVVYHPSDLEWAETHAAQVGKNCLRILQPEWSRSEKVLPLMVEYVKQHPEWQISLQTHKYMNIP